MIAGPVELAEAVYATFGPFVIPVIVFVVGLVGYLVLVALTRAGILGRRGD